MQDKPTKKPEIEPIVPAPIIPKQPEIIPTPEKIELPPRIPGIEPLPKPEIEPVK